MISLPIDPELPGIVDALRRSAAVVLVAEPGAGKTTRVGPAILREPAGILNGDHGRIIMLQPRRVAARSAAARIAEENGWTMGVEVGYHVRFDKRYSAATRLVVLTEAILTRMLLDDPYLEGVGCVILDEFHERNLHTDLAAAFLREIQQTVRPDLKIVVMSATLDAEPISRFLGNAPIINVPGRTYPIEIGYRAGRDRKLEQQVAAAIEQSLTGDGDILVFLPGAGEIERTRRELASLQGGDISVVPLYGTLSAEEQQAALRPDPAGRRKIILATNIAETSLTIDGVRTVVDSGLARIASFDPDRGMDRLDLERISQASAKQRAGRAGRQAAGKVFRLWSEQEQKHLPPFNTPEIQRVDLAWTLLAIHAWGASDVRTFGWFDRPPEDMIAAAERLLEMLGAIEDRGITGAGRRMLSLPVHPRIARLLLAAAGTKWLSQAINLAAILSDDSRGRERGNPLDDVDRVPAHLQRAREQIAGAAKLLPAQQAGSEITELGELLLLAYPDRVARRRGADSTGAVMIGGIGLRLTAEALTPEIAESPLFLAIETHHDPRNRKAEVLVRSACAVDPAWLQQFFPRQLRGETVLQYDTEREKVVGITRRYFGDFILQEDRQGSVDGQAAGAVLAEALAAQARELFFKDDAAAAILARVSLIRRCMPENAAMWPAFDDAALADLLKGACAGKRSLAEVIAGNRLAKALRAALVYPLDRELEKLAPETIQVPSGSRIRIDYPLPNSAKDGPIPLPSPPVLAVRLQEMFGLQETPRICAGRLPVLLHLLSPGFKPIQVTSDLASFWRSAYFEVRKDLRVRYPKHKWPEDPLSALAEAKGRPRR